MQQLQFKSADLELFPDDGKRYEIIDGELYVSKQPDWYHQLTCFEVGAELRQWNRETGAGVVNLAPGLIFGDHDDVAPDLVWVSRARLAAVLGADGKLHAAPDLIVEVLSPGSANQRRDRDAKLTLYSRRGVREYWIINWQRREVEVYRRVETSLQLVTTLTEGDLLASPLLPGFSLSLADLFAGIPAREESNQSSRSAQP